MVRSIASFAMSMCLVGSLAVIGCDKGESDTPGAGSKSEPAKTQTTEAPKPATQPIIPVVQMVDWCPEHGMPESICVQCNQSLAAGFKTKGDWCGSHSVPESQCFKCHPDLKDKFAAAYKTKYGKDAPALGGKH